MQQWQRWSVGLIITVGFWAWWSGRRDGTTHVIVPAVGGDVLLIASPSGQTILIDGGADPAATVSWLGSELPFWSRSLDLVILTRADDQTLPGQIAILRRYSAAVIAYVPPVRSTARFEAWRELALNNRGSLRVLKPNLRLNVGTIELEVLSAERGRATLRIMIGQMRVYALQSLLDGDTLPLSPVVAQRADLVLFPWRVPPDPDLAAWLQPRAVIYTVGGRTALEQTFAERWNGTVPLWHPAIHGRLDWQTNGKQSMIKAAYQP